MPIIHTRSRSSIADPSIRSQFPATRRRVSSFPSLAQADAGSGVLVTSHACDVSDEAQVLRFRDELLGQHARDHVDLVFANAGIGGAGSFVNDSREEWEHTFAVDWWGVGNTLRAHGKDPDQMLTPRPPTITPSCSAG